MQKVCLFIITCLMSVTAWALSPDKDSDNLSKEERRALQEQQDSLDFELAKVAINEGYFVVTARQIRDTHGPMINVNETTNFVLVQGDVATIQIALERGFSGQNGLGGITLEGKVTKVKINEDKKGNINYSMSVLGSGISAEVYFTLPKGGRNCNATVDSNFSNCHITFSGELHPYNTRVTMGKKIP